MQSRDVSDLSDVQLWDTKQHGPGEFYLEVIARGGTVENLGIQFAKDTDGQRSSAARYVFSAYVAMTSPEERAILYAKPQDKKHAISIVNSLTSLLLRAFRDSYLANSEIAPPKLLINAVKFNTIVDNVRNWGTGTGNRAPRESRARKVIICALYIFPRMPQRVGNFRSAWVISGARKTMHACPNPCAMAHLGARHGRSTLQKHHAEASAMANCCHLHRLTYDARTAHAAPSSVVEKAWCSPRCQLVHAS